LLVGPHLGAAAIGAQREIDVKADRHAELMGASLHGIELAARRALQPLVKGDPAGIGAREALHRTRLRIPVFARPAVPAAAVFLAQRFENRERARRAGGRLGIAEDEPQRVQLEETDSGVIDERRTAQLAELALERLGAHEALGAAAPRILRQRLDVEIEE